MLVLELANRLTGEPYILFSLILLFLVDTLYMQTHLAAGWGIQHAMGINVADGATIFEDFLDVELQAKTVNDFLVGHPSGLLAEIVGGIVFYIVGLWQWLHGEDGVIVSWYDSAQLVVLLIPCQHEIGGLVHARTHFLTVIRQLKGVFVGIVRLCIAAHEVVALEHQSHVVAHDGQRAFNDVLIGVSHLHF